MSAAAGPPTQRPRKTSASQLPSARDSDMSEALNGLLSEASGESVDQRRVYMLKCQLAQLERQLLILSEAAAQRRDVMEASCSSMEQVVALCRQCIAQEVRGPTVAVERSRLVALIERCRVAQGTLTKAVDDLVSDRNHMSNLVPNRFANPRKEGKLRDLVSSSHGLAFLNLGRVRQLEGDLVRLYKLLLSLDKLSASIWESGLVPADTQRRHAALVSSSTALLHGVCKDLAELSLLVPSLPPSQPRADRPPPSLQSTALGEDVRRHLREMRSAEGKAAIETKLKALRHEVDRLRAEREVLEEEVARQQRLLDSHAESCHRLVDGLRSGYHTFRRDFRDAVFSPLEAVLDAFDRMEQSPDNRSLKGFLEACKEHFPTVRSSLRLIGDELASGDHAVDPLFSRFRQVLLQTLREPPRSPQENKEC